MVRSLPSDDEETDSDPEVDDSHYDTKEKEFDASWVDGKMDLDSKRAALSVCQSVVFLLSRTGEKKSFSCSGTIIESEYDSGIDESIATVLTSASLLRYSSAVGVYVYLTKGEPLEGEVSHCDYYYNIAIIKFRSKGQLSKAVLRSIFNPVDDAADEPKHDSDLFRLCYGDKVIAMARIGQNRRLLVQTGAFSIDRCPLDCHELLLTTCETFRGYIGGPLINCDGEVIGIIFDYQYHAAFLPANFVSRCLEHFKQERIVPHLSLGMDLVNLCDADVPPLEQITQKFPHINIYNGLIVKNVKNGLPAYGAGIVDEDVIIGCDGKKVKVSIEFWEMMWDRAGQCVILNVLRAGRGISPITLNTAVEPIPDSYNRWPVTPKEILWRKVICNQK